MKPLLASQLFNGGSATTALGASADEYVDLSWLTDVAQGVLDPVLKTAATAAQNWANQQAGFQSTGQTAVYKDGRTGSLAVGPDGATYIIFPNQSPVLYQPTQAAIAPISTQQILSGKTVGIGIAVVLAVGVVLFLVLRKR